MSQPSSEYRLYRLKIYSTMNKLLLNKVMIIIKALFGALIIFISKSFTLSLITIVQINPWLNNIRRSTFVVNVRFIICDSVLESNCRSDTLQMASFTNSMINKITRRTHCTKSGPVANARKEPTDWTEHHRVAPQLKQPLIPRLKVL